jgi:hypothetical protein
MIMALSDGSFLICSERDLVRDEFWYLIEVSPRYFAALLNTYTARVNQLLS